jgi:hypothetical protein
MKSVCAEICSIRFLDENTNSWAIFEKYFDIVGEDQAEKVAYGMKDAVGKHKEKLMNIDVEKSKKENKLVYEIQEERLIMPEGERSPYQT